MRGNQLMWYLKTNLGLTTAQAAGIASNIFAESGFIPQHEQGVPYNQGGIGIAQWTGDRRKKFEDWAKANGKDINSVQDNEQYLVESLIFNHPDLLAQIKGVQGPNAPVTSAELFMQGYEKPGVRRGAHIETANAFNSGYDENQAMPERNKLADADTAIIQSARYVSDASDTVVAGFTKVVNGAEAVYQSFERLAKSAEGIAHWFGGSAVPPARAQTNAGQAAANAMTGALR